MMLFKFTSRCSIYYFLSSYSYYLERTPLITAAKEGHDQLVELFLNSGASVQEKDEFGNSTFK